MFGSIGGPELVVIFAVALMIFGPRRLAELGKSLGRGMAEFRRAATDLRDTLDAEVSRPETPRPAPQSLPRPAEERGATPEAGGVTPEGAGGSPDGSSGSPEPVDAQSQDRTT
jgi:TatA/E family protein of Tat protein translocase